MGLIKAGVASMNSTFADQWKEYFVADSMDSDILMTKGVKVTNGKRTSNTKGSFDVITNGSIVAINEGQAMAIVEDGLVIEFSAEPGAFKFDSSTEGTIFEGSLGSGIKQTFKTMKERFKFGGDVAKNTRVYFFNLKEMSGNKFGTSEPIMYDDFVYQSINLRFFGQATIKLEDPMLFYTNIGGNVDDDFRMSNYWQEQLKSEFVMYLSQATAKLAINQVKYNQITQKQVELASYMNDVLDESWVHNRGLSVGLVGIESISLDPKDQEKIEKIDEMRLMSNQANAAGRMTAATANALENAADNDGGAMLGFAGMNMAMGVGNGQVTQMHQMAAQNQQVVQQQNTSSWNCSCNTENTGNFCVECGQKKPENSWSCTCGNSNNGKFCTECGQKKPDGSWSCNCGEINTSKFCTNCGTKNE